MEKTFERVEELAGTIKDYINTRMDTLKLSVAEKSASVIANVLAGVIVSGVFILFIIFASIALSFGLGEWIGKTWVGFLIVAGLYLFLGIVVWAARGKLIRLPLMNAMIQQLFKKDEEDEDNEKD